MHKGVRVALIGRSLAFAADIFFLELGPIQGGVAEEWWVLLKGSGNKTVIFLADQDLPKKLVF